MVLVLEMLGAHVVPVFVIEDSVEDRFPSLLNLDSPFVESVFPEMVADSVFEKNALPLRAVSPKVTADKSRPSTSSHLNIIDGLLDLQRHSIGISGVHGKSKKARAEDSSFFYLISGFGFVTGFC